MLTNIGSQRSISEQTEKQETGKLEDELAACEFHHVSLLIIKCDFCDYRLPSESSLYAKQNKTVSDAVRQDIF
jgi:hypothetical protein